MSASSVPISEMSLLLLKQLSEETGQPMMEVLDNALDAHRRNLRTPVNKSPAPSHIACEEDRPVPLEMEFEEPLLDPDEAQLHPRSSLSRGRAT